MRHIQKPLNAEAAEDAEGVWTVFCAFRGEKLFFGLFVLFVLLVDFVIVRSLS